MIIKQNKKIKKCTGCKKIKNIDDFAYRLKKQNTRQSKCKSCRNEEYRLKSLSLASNFKNKTNISKNQTKVNPVTINQKKIFDPKKINDILDLHEDSDLKTAYIDTVKHSLSSSTGYNIKEEVVASVLKLNHCIDINGPDAYDDNGNPWEIKTNTISEFNNNTAKFGGVFNDITEKKLLEIPKYQIAVAVFIGSYLFAMATFPGSWSPFMDRLTKEYNEKNSSKKAKRLSSSFHYNDWKDCPEMEWAVLPGIKELFKYRDRVSEYLFDDLCCACTDVMESSASGLTSRSKSVNVRF